jgi:transglutaminase-like putative cysteine protease
LAAIGAAAEGATISERVSDHVERAVDRGLDPLDFHHLYFAFAWRHTLPDLQLAESALDRLAGVRQVDALMVDEVRMIRGQMALEAGRPEAARELFRSMGGVSRWWVHGPVGIDELEDVADYQHPPKDAAWRPVPGTDPLGWLRVSGLAWPARRQLAYLATTLTSDDEQPAAIRIGVAQVARVWLNGREVLETPQPLRRAEDHHAAGSWLRSGRNLLVVAVASEDDDWWLRVRVTAPDGSPLAGVRELDEAPLQQRSVDRQPPEVRTLESELRAAMARGRDRAAIALAAYLVARRPQPVGGGDAARELLEGAIDADPDLHWARIELARWYGERGLHALADGVLTPTPREPATTAVALELDSTLWGAVVLPQLASVSSQSSRCVEAAVILASLAIEDRRWELVREAIDRLDQLVPGADVLLDLKQRLATGCGDPEGLQEVLAEKLRRDPNQPLLRIRMSRLVGAEEGRAGARAHLLEGLGRCPDHVELIMEMARVEHAEGNETEAVDLARRVLEARPQDRRAQRLLKLLGEEGEDLSWLRSPEELWRMADEAPEGSPAVVLLDRVEIRFLPSQLTERRAQQAFLVTSAERADEFLVHTLPYVAERQRLRVLAARILRRGGAEIGGRQSDTARLSEPEYNLYYDTRLRVLRFTDLEDGDLIEISYVLSETAEANETGPYEGGIIHLGHSVPAALTEVELSGPEGQLPRWELVNLTGEPTRDEDSDGTVHLSWSWRGLKPAPADQPPAPRELTMPYLVYSNHPEWGDLATWYERHTAPRVRSSQQVEELSQRLTEGVTDRMERIDRIYRFVTMDIEYVGLEFGEHRFRPFSADWVLNHRIGDCKDKATLLVALYRAIDIPARLVMVRTAERGVPANRLAVLENFNHAIAYLPEDDLWLDGTASGHAMFPPPTMVQGAQVLVVDGPESRPQITSSPGGGLARSRYRLSRGDDGVVELDVRTEDTGEAADRRRVQIAGSRDPRRIARWLQGQFPGADLVEDPELRLVPGQDPALVELRAEVSRSALLGAGGIRSFPGEVDWAAQLTPSSERVTPLLVPVRPDLEWQLEVDLGRPPQPLPEEVRLQSPHGQLALTYDAKATGYRVEGSFSLTPGMVQASEIGELRKFLLAVERHMERRLEVP